MTVEDACVRSSFRERSSRRGSRVERRFAHFNLHALGWRVREAGATGQQGLVAGVNTTIGERKEDRSRSQPVGSMESEWASYVVSQAENHAGGWAGDGRFAVLPSGSFLPLCAERAFDRPI